jgi:uncharacterized damage-inducible protein DinB
MDLVQELVRHHAWATLQLIDYCANLSADILKRTVPATDRSILQMLTHIVGTEQSYLQSITGSAAAQAIRRGEVIDLPDLRQRFDLLSPRWQHVLDRLDELDITLPAEESRPATPHAQYLLVVQAIVHGSEHRAQICTALSLLGLNPPTIDGWKYWAALHRGET